MRSFRFLGLVLASVLSAHAAFAQTEDAAAVFRKANDAAAHSRWTDATTDYDRLAQAGVRAPSLYWNWAQVASAEGRKGEALWALLRARDLAPSDGSVIREIERLRAELGLDPSEMSLGFLGDLRGLAQRLHFDIVASLAFMVSIVLAITKKPRALLSLAFFAGGLILGLPLVTAGFRQPRGVIVQKDAPLVDAAKTEAIALSNLREGEVVPLLGEEGEFVRIQDASGARGFAHKTDVRKIGLE